MAISDIYVPLSVGFARDPKVRSMVFEHGQEGILAAFLYIMMCLYCRENLTDGWVPVAEIPLLVYPLDRETAMQLAGLLQQACLVGASAVHRPPAMQVHAYVKRNGTRLDVERLSDLRKHAARKRWAHHPVSTVDTTVQSNSSAPYAGARAVVETESIDRDLSPVAAPDAGARDDQPRERDLPDIAIWEIKQATGGLEIGRRQATEIIAAIIGNRHLANPGAYLRKAIRAHRDPFELAGAPPAPDLPSTPPSKRRNTAADTPAAQVHANAATVDGRPRVKPATDEQRAKHAAAARAALAAKATTTATVIGTTPATRPTEVVPLPDDPGEPPF